MRPPSPNEVVRAVVEASGITISELCGSYRHPATVFARGLAARMLHQICGMSYPDIARQMARRGHSTFIEGRKRADRMIANHECLLRGDGVSTTASMICARAYLELGYATNGKPLHGADSTPLTGDHA